MGERAYTVSEVDGLRTAIRNQWLWGSCRGLQLGTGMGHSRSYSEPELTQIVEEQVRTHMLAGHTAQDLYANEIREWQQLGLQAPTQ